MNLPSRGFEFGILVSSCYFGACLARISYFAGVGIPKDCLNQVFDRFFRVNDTVSFITILRVYTDFLVMASERKVQALGSPSLKFVSSRGVALP